MADLKLEINDSTEAKAVMNPAAAPAPRSEYTVAAKEGIFKNGTTYKRGQKVELDEQTANRLIEAGDIKQVSTKGN